MFSAAPAGRGRADEGGRRPSSRCPPSAGPRGAGAGEAVNSAGDAAPGLCGHSAREDMPPRAPPGSPRDRESRKQPPHTPESRKWSATPTRHQISAVAAIDSRLSRKGNPQAQWNSEFPPPRLAFATVSGSVPPVKSPMLGLPAAPGPGQAPTLGETASLCSIPALLLHRELRSGLGEMEQGKPEGETTNTQGPGAEHGTFAGTTFQPLPAPHSAGQSGKEPSLGVRGDTSGEVCRLNLNQLNVQGITGFTARFHSKAPPCQSLRGRRVSRRAKPRARKRQTEDCGSARSARGCY